MNGAPKKKDESGEKTGKPERLAKLGTEIVQFALLTLLLALFVWNFNEISRWIGRLQRLVIPGVIELTLQDIRGPATESAPRDQQWATYYRVSEVKVVGAKLDDDEKAEKKKKDPSNAEWVEIMATTFPVVLAGGYIGDSSELRRIPDNTPVLGVGECIRIVTFGESRDKKNICKATVNVTSVQGNDDTGAFLKKDAGEGDRIVVFDRFGRPILDVDYWILEEGITDS